MPSLLKGAMTSQVNESDFILPVKLFVCVVFVQETRGLPAGVKGSNPE
jgi:hypothetical protein